MDTLKTLEQEEKFPTARQDKNEKPASWCTCVDTEEIRLAWSDAGSTVNSLMFAGINICILFARINICG